MDQSVVTYILQHRKILEFEICKVHGHSRIVQGVVLGWPHISVDRKSGELLKEMNQANRPRDVSEGC